jgi:hypothetical protein
VANEDPEDIDGSSNNEDYEPSDKRTKNFRKTLQQISRCQNCRLMHDCHEKATKDPKRQLCQPAALTNGRFKVLKKKKNSVARVRDRTIPTERPPLVVEVSAKFCRQRLPCG